MAQVCNPVSRWTLLSTTILLFPSWILPSPCQARPGAGHLFPPNDTSDNSIPSLNTTTNITVGVYYYPWYADDFHRHDGYLRQFLSPLPHTPTLGEYDDRRPEVIRQHLQWSRQANVQLWVSSWWGPQTREDDTLRKHILNHPELADHQIALFYETTGRIKESEGWEPHRVAGDLAYICQTYFGHKNYYHIDGKPVLFVYLTRLLNARKFQNGTVVLPEVIRIMRETV
jgi:hypothetical protein